MKVVSKEVCTVHATMAVEDSEVGWFFPVADVFWFCEVEYDGNSVFIVLSDWSLVGGGRVCSDGAMRVFGVFGWFEVADSHEHFG